MSVFSMRRKLQMGTSWHIVEVKQQKALAAWLLRGESVDSAPLRFW